MQGGERERGEEAEEGQQEEEEVKEGKREKGRVCSTSSSWPDGIRNTEDNLLYD